MINFTEENIIQFVSEQRGFVLLDLWAPWCGPCKSMDPVLEQLSEDYSENLNIVKLNIDDYIKVSTELNVRSIPAFILFSNGKEVGRKQGVTSKADFITWLTVNNCQNDSGVPTYHYKIYDWPSFYNDQYVREFFISQLTPEHESIEKEEEMPDSSIRQGNLLRHIDPDNDYLSRVFGLPDIFLSLLSFLSFKEVDEINQLSTKIILGKDYSLIHLQVIRHWLLSEVSECTIVKVSDQQQKLIHAWCQAISDVIDDKPLALSVWKEIESEASVLKSNCPPGSELEYYLSAFIFSHSPPVDVNHSQNISAFSMLSNCFYELKYQLINNWTHREIFDVPRERSQWIRKKFAADNDAGKDIYSQGYNDSLYTDWAALNEENKMYYQKEKIMIQQIKEGDTYRSSKEFFISLL